MDLALEHTQTCMLVLNKKGQIRWHNNMFFELLELPNSEQAHLSEYLLHLPAKQIQDFAEVTQSSTPIIKEILYTTPKGVQKWLQLRFYPYAKNYFIHKRQTQSILVINDITTLQKTKASLSFTEKINAEIIKEIPDLLFITDRQDKIIHYHAPKGQKTYVPPEAFMGRMFTETVPKHVAEKCAEAKQKVHSTKKSTTVEYDLAMSNTLEHYECRVVGLQDNSTLFIIRNITKEKQLELAERTQQQLMLTTEQQKLQALFELSPLAMILAKEGSIIDCNKATIQLFGGKEKQDILNKKVIDFSYIPSKNENEILSLIKEHTQESIQKGEHHFHWKHKTLQGQVFNSEVWYKSVYLGSPAVLHTYACIINRDQKAKAEKSIEEALSKTKKINELKDNLIQIVSHEFATPLSIVKSHIQLIKLYLKQQEMPENDKLLIYCERSMEGIDRLNKLQSEILAYAQTKSDKLPFHPVSCNLIELLEHLLENQRFEQIQFHYPSEGITDMMIDPELIHHIFMNLLNNTIKYTSNQKPAVVTLTEGTRSIQIKVQDFGIGIPKEEQLNIFKSFYRASNAVNITGSGLGLYISKQFLDLHQGWFTVDSEEGKGTTFTVHLPK
ncbi:ATP-binding protein [Algivirga pacifica]|uniref:histidine kinase n=1 Tax=Algivirga pacifica TaxID=1162670 RepID=A0ABP9CXZ8_9BACT